MAKINIKSEKNTPYIGIFHVGKVVFSLRVSRFLRGILCLWHHFRLLRKVRDAKKQTSLNISPLTSN